MDVAVVAVSVAVDVAEVDAVDDTLDVAVEETLDDAVDDSDVVALDDCEVVAVVVSVVYSQAWSNSSYDAMVRSMFTASTKLVQPFAEVGVNPVPAKQSSL